MFEYLIKSLKVPEQTKDLLRKIQHWDEDFAHHEMTALLNGKQFGSCADPDYEAQVWADYFFDEEYEIFIVVGTGRMHYHKALAGKLNEKQKLIVVDWQMPLIWKGIHEIDDVSLCNKITWYLHDSLELLLYRVAYLIDEFLIKKIRFGILPPYTYLFRESVSEIEKQISGLVAVNATRALTQDFFGYKWVTNYLENYPYMMRSTPYQKLMGAFKGVPAIVVSAGPSLEKSIHLLSELKNKAVIIGAGSVIDTLKLYGVTPHLLGSFDGGDGNYEHFRKLDSENIRLVYTGDIYPQILREFKGSLIAVEAKNKRTYDYFKQFGSPDLGEVMIGPSVANMALDVAVTLGCDPIILVGQDLAFADGKSHAKGNAFLSDESDNKATIKVKGNYEETVTTLKTWYSMLKFFESQIAEYKDVRIYNATEGGAYIEGTQLDTLDNLKDKVLDKEYDIDAMLNQIIDLPVNSPLMDETDLVIQQIRGDIKLYQNELSSALSMLQKLIDKLDKKYAIGNPERKIIQGLRKREDKLLRSQLYECFIRSMILIRVMYYERLYSGLAKEDPEKVELWVSKYQYELFHHSLMALNELTDFLDKKMKEKS